MIIEFGILWCYFDLNWYMMKLMEVRAVKCDDEMVVFDDLGSSSSSSDIAPHGQIFPTPYTLFLDPIITLLKDILIIIAYIVCSSGDWARLDKMCGR